ncbi:MAG: T9SS type A sorting domain-containing protein [Chitinophagales bacterium]|nr:T9SS type A sorting domain-containing protein [Chitinophagales bacterium]
MATTGYSQSSLRLTVITVSDTAPALGDEILVFANLQNTDTSNAFSGIVRFEVANGIQNLSNSNILSSPPYSGTQITLDPQEEIPALFTVKVDEQYFKAGPDIIVIWPMTTQPPKDSILIPIIIHQALGVEGLTKNKHYLSVNGNQLTIHSGVTANNDLKQVRIFDLAGQLLLQQSHDENNISINIDMLPRGMFICELLLNNNKRNTIKFLKY